MRNSLVSERNRQSSPKRSYKGSPVSKRVTFFEQYERSHSSEPERASRRSPNSRYNAYAPELLNRVELKPIPSAIKNSPYKAFEDDLAYLRDYWLRKLREEEANLDTVKSASDKNKENLRVQLTHLQEEQEHYKNECLNAKLSGHEYLRSNPRVLDIRDGLNKRIDHYNNELLKLKREELEKERREAAFQEFEATVKNAITSRRINNEYLVQIYQAYKESFLGSASRSSLKQLQRIKRGDSVTIRDFLDHSENIDVFQSYQLGSKGLPRQNVYVEDLNYVDTVKKDPRRVLKTPYISPTAHGNFDRSYRTTIKDMKY